MSDLSLKIIQDEKTFKSVQSQIQDLFLEVYGRRFSNKEFEHYYLKSPYGLSSLFALYEQDQLVGSTAIIPQKLKSTDEKIQIYYYLQSGMMIKKEHRNLNALNIIMKAIHQRVDDEKTFVMAFPNEKSFLPLTRVFKWKHVRDFSINQYRQGHSLSEKQASNENYLYDLIFDDSFFKWRQEINQMSFFESSQGKIFYKDYKGQLEVLYAHGLGIEVTSLATRLQKEVINIPSCLGAEINLEGLKKAGEIGNTQRLCIYPNHHPLIDYSKIRPSMLLSDVF